MDSSTMKVEEEDAEENPYTSIPTIPMFSSWKPPDSGDWASKPLASVTPTPVVCAPAPAPAPTPAPTHVSAPGPEAEVCAKSCQDRWEGPAAKYDFLKDIIREKCTSLGVKILSDSADKKVFLCLEGTKDALAEAKMYIYQEMMNVEERKLKLTPVTVQVLQTKCGQSEAEGKLKGLNAKLVDRKGQISVVGYTDDYTKAARMIEAMFFTTSIKIEEHNREFIKSDGWKAALSGVQVDGCVKVTQKAATIDIEGIDHHVKDAKKTLIESLKQNSFKNERMDVKKGVYRFLKQHMADEMEDIRSK